MPDDIDGGTFSIDGFLLDATLDQDFNGTIEFNVTATDLENASSDALFSLEVTPVNDAPEILSSNTPVYNEDCCIENGILLDINDFSTYDADGDNLTLYINEFLIPEDSDYSYDANELLIYPNNNFFNELSIPVYVSDSILDSDVFYYPIIINSINDFPVWGEVPMQSVLEDCANNSCDIFPVNLESFISDVEDENEDLIITIPDDITGGTFTITDFLLDATLVQDFNGTIEFDITATDLENASSDALFSLEITPVNDPPTFSPIDGDGNIEMYEDSIYIEKWLANISPGNAYENDIMTFQLEFDDPDFVEEDLLFTELSAIDSIIKITPKLNANGGISFSVQLSDDGGNENGGNDMSEPQHYILTINPVNDAPEIFAMVDNPLIINEDSEDFDSDYFSAHPGGGDGRFKETNDSFIFEIINDYDTDLFNRLPNIESNNFNTNIGVLSFSLEDNYNGNTDFLVRVTDDGASSASSGPPFNNALSFDTILNVQINQINDMPIEFNIIDSLYAYQVDSSTFIGDSTFRFPYQPFYTSNQLSNKMRFKWQNKPDLDVDLDPNINKDYTMDSLYYYLQMYSEFETINLDTITYQNPSSLDTVIVDIDLTSEKYNIDLTGNTPYYFRVLANNHQLDIFHDDPTGTSNNPCFDEAQESSCSFFIDLTLPTLDMNYLHDDLFIEHFDLYMKASENFVDFDDFDRPLKLWIYYNSVEAQPEILFPDLKDTLNNIYFSSYNFKYSGDINFIYQMRDQAANINQDSLNVSFSIIDPSYPSTISFDDNTVELNFPSSSVNNLTPCLISKTDINFNNGLDMIGYPIKIYPVNIELNDSAVLSFDLDIIPNNYDLNHCGLYYYDNYNWILSDTYIENNKIKSRINNFGSYAIFYNEHEETLSFPDQYILMQNHPNPFNPETMINFYLPEDNYIEINIYNIKGEKVKTIYQGELSSGYQSIKWNGVNDKDISLPSGIYIVSLSYNNQVINNNNAYILFYTKR